MEPSRTEYPALLASLQPEQAVNILNDRVGLINKINIDIADWLQERRKVEEAYVLGLRKLSKRPQQDGAAALGIFQTPWQRIVSGTENLAASHETLALKIESDVETPLRQFSSRNRDMQALTSTQGNLASIAKDFNTAQKKAEKLNAKGGRKADGASTSVDDAARQWESQAPYIFEQLQALDETRVNHLRDVLTQFQTHEVDQVERSRTSAESCLNALLNIETADEIKTFAAKVSSGQAPIAARRSSAAGSMRPQSSSMQIPPTPPPPRGTDDRFSQRTNSTSAQDRLTPLPAPAPVPQKSKMGGLKRLSTVMGRRKSAAPPPPPQSASEKRKEKGRSFVPFRRGDSARSFQDLESTGRDLTPTVSQEPRSTSSQVQSPSEGRGPVEPIADGPPILPLINGTTLSQPPVSAHSEGSTLQPGLMDSTSATQLQTPQPAVLQPPIQTNAEEPVTSLTDPISRAQQEASLATAESDDLSRSFAIRDKPILEDQSEAQQAMNNMANQLRMQAQGSAVSRVQGSMRGRRDVRNSVFVPTPTLPDNVASPSSLNSGIVAGVAAGAATAVAAGGAAELASPTQRPPVKAIPEDHALSSDTTSVHSAHSLAGLAYHTDLHEPGLNTSIVETVNTWFSETGVIKSLVTGEVAFAYNPVATATGSDPAHEEIRLQNFQVLEKVAVNPIFITATKGSAATAEEQAGSYAVAISGIRRPTPTVGLKYQLHIDDTSLAHYSPILITPAWQLVDGQASIIVLYSLNPTFATDPEGSLTLKNAVITVSLDTSSSADIVKPASAMMSPTTGASFKRKAGAVVWRLPELVLKAQQERLLVRFMTPGGTAKKGGIELKFEVAGRTASSIGIEKQTATTMAKEADPFADETGGEGVSERGSAEVKRWEAMPTKRILVSGRYAAA